MNPIENLNKIFDSRIRLGIMSALMVNEVLSFNDLKELLNLSDGNLASHFKTLEEHAYVQVNKSFIGRKSNTTYQITPAGATAFKHHLKALENMISGLGN